METNCSCAHSTCGNHALTRVAMEKRRTKVTRNFHAIGTLRFRPAKLPLGTFPTSLIRFAVAQLVRSCSWSANSTSSFTFMCKMVEISRQET